MKLSPDGPDLPFDLIQAHESGKLVFFCGAGVSAPAGLPRFKKLLHDVLEHESVGLSRLSIALSELDFKNPSEEYSRVYGQQQYGNVIKAYQAKFYDRAFHYLERKLRGERVREAVQDILLNVDAAYDGSTHKALIRLARTRENNVQLVTTNYDHCFQLYYKQESEYSQAPSLPVPRPGRWTSVVHLHGRIDSSCDPAGCQLILSSADFGRAYFTEGWAARFCTELFRNYSTLFVGYSISDPVIRYMIDAIAAEDQMNPEYWQRRYILIG